MLPGKPQSLINYTSDVAKWETIRVEILASIRKRVRDYRNPSATAPVPTVSAEEIAASATESGELSAANASADATVRGNMPKSEEPVPSKPSVKVRTIVPATDETTAKPPDSGTAGLSPVDNDGRAPAEGGCIKARVRWPIRR